MVFRVRVLHSLLLGLAGFSLVLCSFFYATPVALRYGETNPSPATFIASPSPQALEQVASELETTSAGGKRSLQASGDNKIQQGSVKEQEKIAEQNKVEAAENINHEPTHLMASQPAENKTTTDHTVNGSTSGSGVVSSLQPEEQPGPAAPVSTASLEVNKPATEQKNASRTSVIQHIVPKTPAVTSAVKTADFTSLGIVTRSMYESGHDIPNAELCPDFGKSLKVVILITSAPNHADARMAIRLTWGHYSLRKDIAIAFLIGATSDSNLQKEIYTESESYGDLIQSHFQDSYNNLTLKSISLLEWVDTYCYQANFILKTDDDMFINVPKLITFIDKHANDKRTIFGRLAKKWKPIRNKKSKYYVSKEQYKHILFPDFTTGPAYLMTSDVVHDLYTSALNQTYLKLEDVFTTGIVAQEMKVKRVHVNEFLNKRIVFHACHIQKGISIHMVKFHEQFDLWKKLLDGKTKCK